MAHPGVDQVRIERNRLMRIGRPQDAARPPRADRPCGDQCIAMTPPGAARIGRLHIRHNPVRRAGSCATRLMPAPAAPGPALSTR